MTPVSTTSQTPHLQVARQAQAQAVKPEKEAVTRIQRFQSYLDVHE